ncbi:hypothetical protein J0A67_10240 [Algoriphagus aestuariicola]|jgi:hypothetical protein|uniref:Uncharacterized protein n=1 Tax=Algoriphagus aestuariicola TaxID=1852016 RepID=A0ABS3BPM0_9BACT|nr:hypothetical protein [Algoriphagus aestuariicola]MBN7801243.1 hypothetical protein [Algoriphagus aestuariicola]
MNATLVVMGEEGSGSSGPASGMRAKNFAASCPDIRSNSFFFLRKGQ